MSVIFVAGAGLMGSDIALLFAGHGYKVLLFDVSRDSLFKARNVHLRSSNKYYEEGLIRERDAYKNITYTTDLSEGRRSEFVFEAVTEDIYIKRRLFRDMEKYVSRDVVFATNTSSYRVSEIAPVLENPRRLGAMHFSNPPLIMKLIEVASGEMTSDSTIDVIIDVAYSIGKEPILLDRECRGFVLNRLLYVAFVDALMRLEGGVKPEDLDAGIKNLGVPYGVVEAMDLIGLDTVKRILDNLIEEYGDRYIYPSRIIDEKIGRGELGKKSGKGFYVWREGNALVPEGEPIDPTRSVAVVINEAYKIVGEGVADKSKIDTIYQLGVNAPVGLFEVAQLFGEEYLRDLLDELYSVTGHMVYKWIGK